jgi:transcription initiation factor TFIIIB Brf1 subunit/transcription initiation factor TFIIB
MTQLETFRVPPPMKCEECGGDIVFSGGEHVCSLCGLVYDFEFGRQTYVINKSSSTETPASSNAYVSPGERLHLVDGLGSYIDYPQVGYFRDVTGEPLSPRTQNLFSRLKWYYDKRERFCGRETEYRALCSLKRVVEILNLGDSIRDYAAYLYRKAVRNANGKKYSTSIVLIALCLFLAMKETNKSKPVRIDEITKAFNKIGHRVSTQSIIHASLNYLDIIGVRIKTRRSENYLSMLFQKMLSSEELKTRLKKENKKDIIQYCNLTFKTSLDILSKIDNSARGGRNPYVFAVSTVYAADKRIAEEEKNKPILTQGLIAKIAGVAEYSVREHFSMMKKFL